MLAIHNSPTGFHPRWIAYCELEGIAYRKVDCYANDLIQQLQGCSGLMWHHDQSNPKDILIARPILNALEHAGIPVFPDFRTAWHFDDKVAQKYLFEALDIPAVPAHVFVDRNEAMAWIERTEFPKVFKLRRGAGSHGVRLAKSRAEARGLVRRAFGHGFPIYDPVGNLKERLYKARRKQASIWDIAKGLIRFARPPAFSRILGRERGYVYFQDYLEGNEHDIRVIVIGDRAFGIRRLVRSGDFRASGSGHITHRRDDIDEHCISMAFEATDKLGSSCAAFDFVFDHTKHPWIIEVSYGFNQQGYDPCEGHWDRNLNWHPGPFNPQGWMVESLLASMRQE